MSLVRVIMSDKYLSERSTSNNPPGSIDMNLRITPYFHHKEEMNRC